MKTTGKKTTKSKSKSTKKMPVVNNGVQEGQYSRSTWNNGELISFDIDWDKLAAIVKNIDKGPATK